MDAKTVPKACKTGLFVRSMEWRYRWKIGSDGRSVSMAVSMEELYRKLAKSGVFARSMEWRYRWKIGIDGGIDGRSVANGRSVAMEDWYRWRYRRKICIDARTVGMEDR
jgi:hypothetical protein